MPDVLPSFRRLSEISLIMLLLLAGCSNHGECESPDGYGIAEECLPRYEAVADAGNTDTMYRLYLYWESEGDKAKANTWLERAADGGSTMALMPPRYTQVDSPSLT